MKRLLILLALGMFVMPMLVGCEAEGKIDDDGVELEVDD